MKIAFLCGTLEPGGDGVGDYTRRLAGELLKQGHRTMVLSLRDPFIMHETFGSQCSEEIEIPVLRIPTAIGCKKSLERAKECIDAFDPEWLSLQYVPFSFHSRGLHSEFNFSIKELGKGRKWHIMFHELWVGMANESSFKLKLWGAIQRQLIRSLAATLNPKVVHTQTQLYKEHLNQLGFKAEYLPLFSNIPVAANKSKTVEDESNWQKTISFVVFGNIHPDAPVDQLVKEAASYAEVNKVKIKLQMIGRNGKEHKRWADAWKAEGLQVEIYGEQPAERISEILVNASLGITTTAYAVVEKSGAVAAMQAHGLPVLCVAPPWTPRGIKSLERPAGITEYHKGNLEKCLQRKRKTSLNNKLSEGAHTMVGELLSVI